MTGAAGERKSDERDIMQCRGDVDAVEDVAACALESHDFAAMDLPEARRVSLAVVENSKIAGAVSQEQ